MSESMFMSLDDEFGKNGYIIRESKIQKGCEYPVHWHDYFEFEVILDGTGIHTLNDRKYTVSAGSAYLLSYCDFHSIRADTDMRLINLRFCEEAAEKELVDYIQPGASRFCVQFAEEEFKRIIRFTDTLYQEQNSEKPFAEIMSKSMISAIVTELIRKSASFSPSKYRPKHVQSAVALIRRDFRNDLTLFSAAKKLAVSANHLGVIFKKSLGISFADYLNMTRLKYACGLLCTSSLSVKQIAFESGYNSAEYFVYVFKQKLGVTPSEYRKAH